MIIGTFDTDLIPSSSIREYFEETLANYTSGHYRSAIVLLYSTVITDLMQKLKILDEVFEDAKAKSILGDVQSKKTSNPKDPSWEGDVIENVLKTSIVDTEVYAKIQHLKDQRNLAAHPVLNSDFELIQPSKETVIDFIKFFYEKLLTVPAHFMGNIVSKMTDDLAKFDTCVQTNPNYLDKYILDNYVARSNDACFRRIFKAYWKFVFKDEKIDDEKNFLLLNVFTLNILTKYGKEWCKKIIQSGEIFQTTGTSESTLSLLFSYFKTNYDVYPYVNEGWKSILDNFINDDPNYILCSWFKTSPKEHLESLNSDSIKLHYLARLRKDSIDCFFAFYQDMGELEQVLDVFIKIFGMSGNYETTKNLYDDMIHGYLSLLNQNQFTNLLSAMNCNDQIYNRDRSIRTMMINIKDEYQQKFGSPLQIGAFTNLPQ